MNEIKSMSKSILIGGAAAGIISLIPFVNLLNLIFMLWMAVGGGICVYLLVRDNPEIKTLDAALAGAMSGALGSCIFGAVSYILVANISPENFQRMSDIIRIFSSVTEEDMTFLVQGDELKSLFLIILAVSFFLSIIAGALGGTVTRKILKKSPAGTPNALLQNQPK